MNFKESWNARTILRAVVAMALAGLAVAGTIWVDNPYLKIASAMALVLPGYLGVGAISGSVEPFFGRQLEGAQVPAPPADPEPVGTTYARAVEESSPGYAGERVVVREDVESGAEREDDLRA